MNYYERHIGDYLKDTAHLSLLEHGVYTRLMDVYYTRESGLPQGEAARLIGARSKDERTALTAVLAEFFVLRDATYFQERCDREIDRYHGKQAKAKASADARWGAQRSLSEGNANASANQDAPGMRTHSEGNALQSPVTRHQEEISNLSVAPARPSADQPQLTLVGTPVPAKPEGPTDCPHLELLALWQEVLPALPQHLPEQWRGSRADHLRTRWRETAVLKRWTDKAQGIAYFRKLFGFVGKSAFLTGRVSVGPGKRPFVIELEWLVNPTNWAKVIEGKYHEEATA